MKCAIITPVGPGHLQIYNDRCEPSISRAIGYSTGPFSDIEVLMMDDTQGRHGRSARRNEALRIAQQKGCEWVFFLDADDIMTPNAFEAFGEILKETPDAEAVWGLIATSENGEDVELRPEQVVNLDNVEEFLAVRPYNSIQIGFFGRTECVARFGFDEDMDTGEDFKLYYQLWGSVKCIKRPAIFFINIIGQHSTGPRCADGYSWAHTVNPMWADECRKYNVTVTSELNLENLQKFSFRLTDPLNAEQYLLCTHDVPEEELLGLLVTHGHAGNFLDIGSALGFVPVFAQSNQIDSIAFASPSAIEDLEQNIDLNTMGDMIPCLVIPEDGDVLKDLSSSFIDGLTAIRLCEDVDHKLVLETMASTIAAQRPAIWINCRPESAKEVLQKWMRQHQYQLIARKEIGQRTSYFFIPKS